MIIRPRHASPRLLAAVLVMIQIAFSALGALPHPGERASKVVTLDASGTPGSASMHDELRCPICQFTAQHAQPILGCITIACTDAPEAPHVVVAPTHAELPPHFTPSWRAPPVSLS